MGKAVRIYVVDNRGNTVCGAKVNQYGEDPEYTDGDGCVTLLLEGSSATIYVNGNTAYNGSVYDLDPKEVFTTTGGRP